MGRAVCSVRDNYIAAESIGVHVSRFKIMAFVVSAFFAGVAGVLYAHNVGIIKPTTFDYNKSIEILGLSSSWAAWAASAVPSLQQLS